MSCSGYPGTISLAAASLDAPSGPFGTTNQITRAPPAAAQGMAPIEEGGLSQGKKDTAIAVPVILGALIAACGSFLPQHFHCFCSVCGQAAVLAQHYVILWSG